MPRQAREVSPTGYYHIMMRGINRDSIYQSAGDKSYFIKTLKKLEGLSIAAYCVMDNHVHIVLQAELAALMAAIRKLNLTYAMWYNSIHERVGHVYQNRYRSEIVTSDRHLLQVVRYVHNNPVKAGLAKEAKQYTWSSYREYLEGADIISHDQKQFVLGLISNGNAGFIAFHGEPDVHEYLDTDEDIAELRRNHAQSIIEKYCRDHGIVDRATLKRHPVLMEDLIMQLLQCTHLSHRKIAAFLEVSANIVHRASLAEQEQD
jgi:REP element-mobilizing transposase RayT